jgi:hypothetical protein
MREKRSVTGLNPYPTFVHRHLYEKTSPLCSHGLWLSEDGKRHAASRAKYSWLTRQEKKGQLPNAFHTLHSHVVFFAQTHRHCIPTVHTVRIVERNT